MNIPEARHKRFMIVITHYKTCHRFRDSLSLHILIPLAHKNLILSLLACILFSAYNGNAQQQYYLSGTVKDTIGFLNTQDISVSLIQVSDSFLCGTTVTNNDSYFHIAAGQQKGIFLLTLSNPLFTTYTDTIAIKKDTTGTGTLYILPREHALQEVVIHNRQAISIKGDTTEFTALSLKW